MICPKCNSTILDTVTYCPHCGENFGIKYCSSCGEVIKEGDKFCAKCGTIVNQTNVVISSSPNDTSDGKIRGSYYVSVINAIICFIIRIAIQEEYYLRGSGLLNGQYVMGIFDDATKKFLTFIPVVAAIIVSLMIVSDKKGSSQEKLKALIINSVFIGLSVLFVWFNIPWDF